MKKLKVALRAHNKNRLCSLQHSKNEITRVNLEGIIGLNKVFLTYFSITYAKYYNL
jgi:hypothetical protein